MPTPLSLPPLALYIHIPWCIRKCPYCDFNSHAASSPLPETEYVDALIRDLARDTLYAQGRRLGSIFFGGGTPSLFSATAFGRILDGAEELIGFDDTIEITLEANPGTFEQNKFRDYRKTGINRLSIGIQSFNDQSLQALGRVHDGDEARRAIGMVRSAGFDNFNLDLMHGLPRQGTNDALADLETALAFEPPHLSWYQLTIEPNTMFHRTPPTLPPEDTLADIQEAGSERLGQAGLQQYEVSAFALPGQESHHNRNYWEFGDYLGVGAGAHGKITLPQAGRILRTSKTRLPNDYLARKQKHLASSRPIEPAERPLEFLMNGLRLVDGVPLTYFEERTGTSFAQLTPRWQSLVEAGLLQPVGERLAATPMGLRFLDTVLTKLDP